MRRRSLLFALALAPVPVPMPARATEALPVVASFSILADMVRQVAGALATVTSLVPPDGDVHTYEPRPGDLRALSAARLLAVNGLGLEGWMDRLAGAAAYRGIIVTAAAGVTPRAMQQGGGPATMDPHAWQDPRNGVLYVGAIAEGLARADPPNAAAYHAAGARYADQIRQIDAWIESELAPIPAARRTIITTHDAFGYFGARYGVNFLAPEGISTDSEPSAAAIAALVRQIRRAEVRTVFIENMTDPRMARMLARETGASLGGTLYSDALSPPDGPAPTYLAMFRHNVTLFVQAMQPQ
jgi:zinc/manganese transport system substrate-binding protein